MQLNRYTTVFVLSCSTLLSCGTPSSEDSLSPPTSHRKLVSEVQFEDDVLARCVKRHSAVYVDELKSLTCTPPVKHFAKGVTHAVRSAKGIEELTALESLDLSMGWIGEINTSTLSKLKHLDLSNNIIQTLDLSHSSSLQVLNLSMNPLYEVVLPLKSNLHEFNISQKAPFFSTLDQLGTLEEDPLEPPLSSEFFDVVSGLLLNSDSYARLPIIDYSTQTKLEVFSATNRKFDIASLKSLPEQNNIKELDLSDYTISVLNEFVNMNNLETLRLSDTRLSGARLNVTVPNIKEMEFRGGYTTGKIVLNCTGLEHLRLHSVYLGGMDLSACKTKKLTISATTQAKGLLSLPEGLISLTLYNSNIEDIEFTNASHLEDLDISFMSELAEIDFTPLHGLTDLRILGCKNLRQLDISPLSDMDGQLSLGPLQNLESLKAIGLQNLSEAVLGELVSLNDTDRFNIEQLTNTKIK